MMITELLVTLRDLKVHLYVEGDTLKCRAPHNVLTDELKNQLKTRKSELIESLAQIRKHHQTPITPVLRTKAIPLSFAQQRLWFLDQLEPDSSFYNIPVALRLKGKLNESALEQSINEIIRRHESLRTTFITVEGQAEQAIAAQLTVPVVRRDLTALPEQISQTLMLNVCHQEAVKPFELSSGPLVRVTLISLCSNFDSQEYVLLVTLHHIISDGWSSGLLIHEFASLYEAFSNGKTSPLEELLIQYADFAYWQRQWLEGEVLQRQIDFWQQQLSGASAMLELPTDYPRPPVISYHGANHHFTVPPELSKKIYSLSRSYDATLFVTLLAAFKVLLFRYSHQQDVCVGTPIANRNRLEIEKLIGFFVNTLVLRSKLSGDQRFDTFLKEIRNTVLDAQNHQDLPFEQLVEILRPERNMSYSPLFQVMFALQKTSRQSSISDLEITSVDGEGTSAKFDLTLHINEDETGLLTGTIEYNTDLFDQSTIARLAEHFLILLQGIVIKPQALISELPLLNAAERYQLLIGFNGTAVDYPHEQLIHQLFEQQARQDPDTTAVVYEGQSLSYRELNQRANQLAHYLLELGIRPDDRVAICVERSPDMVVGVLGILKSGGAYVPLDPDYPQDRISFILEDTQASILLTQEKLIRKLPSSKADVICLDKDRLEIDQYDCQNPTIESQSSNLAYVIYTSGSTGRPKGALVSHHNLVCSTLARFSAYQDPVKAYLLLSSFAFDSSVAGIFWTLAQGGCLCLPTENNVKDPFVLGDLIYQNRISHLLALPSFYALLLRQVSPQLNSLKTIIVAGESCTVEIIKEHQFKLPGVNLYNEYGPTEGTVWSSVYLTNKADINLPVSIGRPIENVKVYILDKNYVPVPFGVQGELYLGGKGVVRGYLNRSDLTAEKFIPDPFSNIGNRLYRTGDLARYRPDGNIEFFGRNDTQVKIRGFRIELGEIEAHLAKCPGVREAVVLVREDSPGDQRLVAYLLAQDNAVLSAAEVRSQLATVLADYQLPSAYVALDAFPLTPNGKLDRKALPAPDGSAVVSRAYVAPLGPIENAIARIWQELLHLEQVGRHDHFFELGGHSLLAVQLISHLRQQLGEISLNEVFAQPTLSGFAFSITNQSNANRHANLVSIRSAGKLVPLFLVHPRGGQVNYARLMLPWLDADLPIYGINATGFIKDETPLLTVEEMAALYIQAIRHVQPNGPYRIVGYSSGGSIAYEMAYQLIGADENVEFLGLIDAGIELKHKAIENPEDFDECEFLLEWVIEGETPVSFPILEELKILAALADLDAMLECCHSSGLIPQEIDSTTLRRYLAVYHANDQALAAYSPAPVSIPLYLFAATENSYYDDKSYGWEVLVGNQLHTIPIGGDHYSLLEPPHVETLGKAISEVLRDVSWKSATYPEQRYSPMVLIQNGRIGTLPLFCVPGAGAGATTFFGLSQALDTNLPVYGLQPRGLDGILVPHIDVPSAARAYIKAIREVSPTGPYRLLGHSFGGWVVFEMALQLTAAGEQIDTLIVLDSEAPSIPGDKMQRYSRVGMLLELVNLYELSINRTLVLTAHDFSSLDNEQQLTLLLSRLIEVRLMPPRTTIETLRGIVRVFEINLNTGYIPKGFYPGEIHLVGVANIDSKNLDKDKKHQELITQWRQHASKVNFWKSPGNHITLLNPPHVLKLAKWLYPSLLK